MIDSNGPVLNTRLVNAMQEMLEDNNERTRSKMINALMNATLLSPVIRQIAVTEEAQKEGAARMRFTLLSNTKGEKYYMAFTDWAALNKWKKEKGQQVVHMDFDDFAAVVTRKDNNVAGFVINPFSENITIPKEMVISLKKQKDQLEKGTGRGPKS